MSGFTSNLKAASTQKTRYEDRYSSDSDLSEVTSTEVEPKVPQDTFSDPMYHVFFRLKYLKEDGVTPNSTQHGVSNRMVNRIAYSKMQPKEQNAPVARTCNSGTTFVQNQKTPPKKDTPNSSKPSHKSSSKNSSCSIKSCNPVLCNEKPTFVAKAFNNNLEKKLEVLHFEIVENSPERSSKENTQKDQKEVNIFKGVSMLDAKSDNEDLEKSVKRIAAVLIKEKTKDEPKMIYPQPMEFNNNPNDTPQRFIKQFNKYVETYATGVTTEDLLSIMDSFIGPGAKKKFNYLRKIHTDYEKFCNHFLICFKNSERVYNAEMRLKNFNLYSKDTVESFGELMKLFEILDIRDKKVMTEKAYHLLNSTDRQFVSLKNGFDLSDIIEMLSIREYDRSITRIMRRSVEKQYNTVRPKRSTKELGNFSKGYRQQFGTQDKPELVERKYVNKHKKGYSHCRNQTPRNKREIVCWNCNKKGHYGSNCRLARQVPSNSCEAENEPDEILWYKNVVQQVHDRKAQVDFF
ncbi:hypothetical protein AX774_g1085 [Zancudomyces culisetae]|uniref:CCHC-type domain-containing protein n=1 Tax=Zancudomyces culisetae TaxID=1213189 RepID=A0A1R1PWT0_ZANCU|nr:hypothetical protein AX774_g1085 [Zancudomyces culisetae]|eukprot:OMH85362.1 hypothetical protein AX774_g1085 [Zancudomyces culisetae]